MASQSSGSKPKKGLRSFLKETLHVRSRSKSPSQPSDQQAQKPGIDPGLPSGTATAATTPSIELLDDGRGSRHGAGVTRTEIARPSSPPNPAWAELGVALRSLKNAAGAFPRLVSVIELFLSCLDGLEMLAKRWSDYEGRATNLSRACNSLERSAPELDSALITSAVCGIILSLEEQVAGLKEELDRKAGQSDPEVYYELIQKLFRQLEANLNIRSPSVTNEAMVKRLVERLNPAKNCTHNSGGVTDVSRTCAEGTRTGILAHLDEWTQNPETDRVCWISGTQGTGKTTIARTFCERLDERKLLAASFFCARVSAECVDPHRIVPTVAHQLAEYSAPFRDTLYEALTESAGTDAKDGLQQFELLINRPLAKAKNAMPSDIVIVIDGLDECGDQEGQRLIVGILDQYAKELPVKLLVTSRRQPETNTGTDGPERWFKLIHLDDIERPLVRHDLKQYLKAELHSLAPTTTQLERLVDRTDMLFICVAVLVRFILLDSPRSSSQQRLELILSMTLESTKKHTYIDALYEAILRSVLEEEATEDGQRIHTRVVLWTVLFAQGSIGLDTIAMLSGIDNLQDVKSALRPLQPVLHHSEESGLVSPLHASFPEFMLNTERSGAFFYDIAEHSRLIAERCFRVMETGLRFNICGLESSFIPDREVRDLEARIQQKVSPTMIYACRYWASHLELSAICDRLRSALEEFLSGRLLFWMEVLNLRKELAVAVKALTKTSQWLKVTNSVSPELTLFVRDACDFVTSYAANPISASTPHIYLSALPFCPRSSQVYKTYSKRATGLLQLDGGVIEQRRTAPLAVWNAGYMVTSIAYSPDGSLLAFGCRDGPVGICDATDGSPVAEPLNCGIEDVTCVAFSPDSSKLAAGSEGGILQIWNVVDWKPVTGPVQVHTDAIMSVAFSPDGTLIATGSRDRTTRIWNVKDGSLAVGPLEGRAQWKVPVAFTPDGTHVASASADYAIHMWNICGDTPTSAAFIGHTRFVSSFAFNLDGTRLISGSLDGTLRVWTTSNVAAEAILLIRHSHGVDDVAILPNSGHIASCAYDGTVRVWNNEDGTLVAGPFFGPRNSVNAIAASPDGTRIASGSNDCTIRVWAIYEGLFPLPRLNQGTFDIAAIMFSPTESRIYSTSRTGANIWDIDQGLLATATTLGTPYSTHSLPLSPDGASIVVFLDDYSAGVVSSEDGKYVAGPFRGHTNSITSAAFSADGAYLATGSEDRTVRVWSVDGRGAVAGPLVGHTAAVTMVALSYDGSRAVSCSLDDNIRVWNTHDSIIEMDMSPDCDTSNRYTNVFEGWTVRDDGWAVNGESRPLFWIPLDFPAQPSPYTQLSITRHYGSSVLTKQKVLLGPRWDSCYISE